MSPNGNFLWLSEDFTRVHLGSVSCPVLLVLLQSRLFGFLRGTHATQVAPLDPEDYSGGFQGDPLPSLVQINNLSYLNVAQADLELSTQPRMTLN